MFVLFGAVYLLYTVLGIGVESYDRITCIDPNLGRVGRVQRGYKKIDRCVCGIVPSILLIGRCGLCVDCGRTRVGLSVGDFVDGG